MLNELNPSDPTEEKRVLVSTFDISLPNFIPLPADLKTDAWFMINLASCILQLQKEAREQRKGLWKWQ